MRKGAAALRADGFAGDVKVLTSCPSCLQGLSRFDDDAGTQADYIVVEIAKHVLGAQLDGATTSRRRTPAASSACWSRRAVEPPRGRAARASPHRARRACVPGTSSRIPAPSRSAALLDAVASAAIDVDRFGVRPVANDQRRAQAQRARQIAATMRRRGCAASARASERSIDGSRVVAACVSVVFHGGSSLHRSHCARRSSKKSREGDAESDYLRTRRTAALRRAPSRVEATVRCAGRLRNCGCPGPVRRCAAAMAQL